MKTVPKGLADLERNEGGYRVSAFYLPDLETRESVAVVITLAEKEKHIDTINVSVEDGFDAYSHPSMYSDPFRMLLNSSSK